MVISFLLVQAGYVVQCTGWQSGCVLNWLVKRLSNCPSSSLLLLKGGGGGRSLLHIWMYTKIFAQNLQVFSITFLHFAEVLRPIMIGFYQWLTYQGHVSHSF